MQIPRWMGGHLTDPLAAKAPSPALAASAALVPHQVGIVSPMSDQSTLQAVVWADLTGNEAKIVDRSAAMSIPALARQRHLLTGTAARCPLVLVDRAGTPAPEQPRWLTNTLGILSAYHRTLWTMDDLVFHPFSVWLTERDDAGQIVDASRCPADRWETDEADRLVVDGELADESEVIVIPGPHEGILNFGGPALTRTLDNLDAAAKAARNPAAYLELHYTGDEPLTPDAKAEVVADWAKARQGINGGVAITGKYLEVKEHGTHEGALLIAGRNADAVDVSRLVSSPAAMADAEAGSLTYETTEGRGGQFLDYGAALYMDSLVARLSMDDVSPEGMRVIFDTTNITALSAVASAPSAQE